MMRVFYVALGGAIGSAARFVLSGGVHAWIGSTYPWGTFVVNLAGSFAAGFLWRLFEQLLIAPHLRPFIFIGVLGGFTTFSSYMLETLNLCRDGQYLAACGNMTLHTVCGMVCVMAGWMLAQVVLQALK